MALLRHWPRYNSSKFTKIMYQIQDPCIVRTFLQCRPKLCQNNSTVLYGSDILSMLVTPHFLGPLVSYKAFNSCELLVGWWTFQMSPITKNSVQYHQRYRLWKKVMTNFWAALYFEVTEVKLIGFRYPVTLIEIS